MMQHRQRFAAAATTTRRNTPFFFFLLLILSLSFLVSSTSANGQNTYESFKARFKTSAKDSKNRLAAWRNRFKSMKDNYNRDRSHVITDKRNTVKRMSDRTNHYFDNRVFASKCRGSSNYQQCVKNQKKSFNSAVYNELKGTANALRTQTTNLAKNYMRQTNTFKQDVEKEKKRLKKDKSLILKFHAKNKFGNGKNFGSELSSINNYLDQINAFLNNISGYVTMLQGVVLQSMCFELKGATGTIKTQRDKKAFEQLTKEAMEIAAAQQGINADVLGFIILKQEFHQFSRRRRRQLLRKKQDDEDEEERQLAASGTQKLHVGTVTGVTCNCKDDPPKMDAWRRLSYKEEEEMPLEQEEYKNNNSNSNDDDNEDETSSSLSILQPQENNNFLANITSQEEFEAFMDFVVLEMQQDDNLALQDEEQDVSQEEEGVLPFSLYNNDQDIQQQRQDEEEERNLLGTNLKKRFVAAMNHVYQSGSLAGVYEVNLISCNGFLHVNPASYINRFK